MAESPKPCDKSTRNHATTVVGAAVDVVVGLAAARLGPPTPPMSSWKDWGDQFGQFN
jgi:hypothetical protein